MLLLDEATSALDQTTEAAINRTLLKVAKGRTMIWSTHRLTSVVEMDEIIVISGGKAIERGSHARAARRATASTASSGTTRATRRTTPPAQADDDNEDDDDEDDDEEMSAAALTSAPIRACAAAASVPSPNHARKRAQRCARQ